MTAFRSIATQIVVSVSLIVFVLLLVGGGVLIQFEVDLIESSAERNLRRLEQVLHQREQAAKKTLQQELLVNADILNESGSPFLFFLAEEDMKQLLRAYMKHPEILAIRVFDEQKEPFAATWRRPDVSTGKKFPDDVTFDDALSIQVDSLYEAQKVGGFQIYYTDAALHEEIERDKSALLTEAQEAHRLSRTYLDRAITAQVVSLLALIAILVFCLVILLRRLVVQPISAVSDIARRLAEFDLTVNIHTRKEDEIGRLIKTINAMVRTFREAIGHAQQSGLQVSSSSAVLATTASQQDGMMAHQAESTQSVMQSILEITDVVTKLTDTMQEVASTSKETAELANNGRIDLSNMQDVMHHLAESSQTISAKLGTINEKANKITNIVVTIAKVAEQTNLLSLNASIEAEKAGEFGRGFSVVAREIRRLADQSAVATLDIEHMIQEMQTAVSAGVMEMDKFIAEVRHSAEDVERISMQLTRIIERVQALSPKFQQVNAAMEQESVAARAIDSAITSVNEEMQQTRRSLHETFLAIRQLNESVGTLQKEVDRFRVE